MAGNMFLMVTLDKILSICCSCSNQTAKHILQWCGWDHFPISKRVVTVLHSKNPAALKDLCFNSIFLGWQIWVRLVSLSDVTQMGNFQYLYDPGVVATVVVTGQFN